MQLPCRSRVPEICLHATDTHRRDSLQRLLSAAFAHCNIRLYCPHSTPDYVLSDYCHVLAISGPLPVSLGQRVLTKLDSAAILLLIACNMCEHIAQLNGALPGDQSFDNQPTDVANMCRSVFDHCYTACVGPSRVRAFVCDLDLCAAGDCHTQLRAGTVSERVQWFRAAIRSAEIDLLTSLVEARDTLQQWTEGMDSERWHVMGECGQQQLDLLVPHLATTCSNVHVALHEIRCQFDDYFQTLATEKLGRTLIYKRSVDSTMSVLKRLPLAKCCEHSSSMDHGLLVLADRQTQGRGRGANVWISGEGALLFSLRIVHDVTPRQAHTPRAVTQVTPRVTEVVCWTQHLLTLAMCLVLNSCLATAKSYIRVRIKWPNDLYVVLDHTSHESHKIGGVLVEAAQMDDVRASCSVGVGLNLDSSTTSSGRPTRGVVGFNTLTSVPVSRHGVLAQFLNQLERLIDMYMCDTDAVTRLYTQHWMHQGQRVEVPHTAANTDTASFGVPVSPTHSGTVCGVDKFGYMQVRLADSSVVTVMPDGNSFDMMRGLVTIGGHSTHSS